MRKSQSPNVDSYTALPNFRASDFRTFVIYPAHLPSPPSKQKQINKARHRHAFQKKTRKTRREDIELAARRYKLKEVEIMNEKITKSSGNVFTDLGFDAGEAVVLQMRAKLMNDLRDFIRSSGMSQTEAAKRLGITQSRVSDLMRGKWDKFSLEMLVSLEARIGRKITLDFAA